MTGSCTQLESVAKFWGSERTAENGRTLLGDKILEQLQGAKDKNWGKIEEKIEEKGIGERGSRSVALRMPNALENESRLAN